MCRWTRLPPFACTHDATLRVSRSSVYGFVVKHFVRGVHPRRDAQGQSLSVCTAALYIEYGRACAYDATNRVSLFSVYGYLTYQFGAAYTHDPVCLSRVYCSAVYRGWRGVHPRRLESVLSMG